MGACFNTPSQAIGLGLDALIRWSGYRSFPSKEKKATFSLRQPSRARNRETGNLDLARRLKSLGASKAFMIFVY